MIIVDRRVFGVAVVQRSFVRQPFKVTENKALLLEGEQTRTFTEIANNQGCYKPENLRERFFLFWMQ